MKFIYSLKCAICLSSCSKTLYYFNKKCFNGFVCKFIDMNCKECTIDTKTKKLIISRLKSDDYNIVRM